MSEFDYKHGIRILILIQRKKDGGTQEDRSSIRRISGSNFDFDKHVSELWNIAMEEGGPWRLYSSVNARDWFKALRLYRIQQIEKETHMIHEQVDFYMQSQNQVLSCLAKPQSRSESYFLIDLDDVEDWELKGCQEILSDFTTIRDVRKTPNGYHIITDPYNPNDTPHLNVKKDAMILLRWFNDRPT